MSDYTDALRRELGYYEKQGKDARADEVRAELARAERADAAAARAEEAAKPDDDVEEPSAPAKATGRSLRRGKETAVAAPAETTAETGAGEEPQPEPETDEA